MTLRAPAPSPLPPKSNPHPSGLMPVPEEPTSRKRQRASPEPATDHQSPVVKRRKKEATSRQRQRAPPEPATDHQSPVVKRRKKEATSRQRQPASPEPTTDHQSPVVKRRKSNSEEDDWSGYPDSFYDTLSRIRLSRGALRLYDRRIDQTQCSPSLLPKPTTPSLPGQDLHKIKQFARHGGPNLAHLRGVCQLHTWYEHLADWCGFQFSTLRFPVDDTMNQSSSRGQKRPSGSNQSGSNESSPTKPRKSSADSGDFEMKLWHLS